MSLSNDYSCAICANGCHKMVSLPACTDLNIITHACINCVFSSKCRVQTQHWADDQRHNYSSLHHLTTMMIWKQCWTYRVSFVVLWRGYIHVQVWRVCDLKSLVFSFSSSVLNFSESDYMWTTCISMTDWRKFLCYHLLRIIIEGFSRSFFEW